MGQASRRILLQYAAEFDPTAKGSVSGNICWTGRADSGNETAPPHTEKGSGGGIPVEDLGGEVDMIVGHSGKALGVAGGVHWRTVFFVRGHTQTHTNTCRPSGQLTGCSLCVMLRVLPVGRQAARCVGL